MISMSVDLLAQVPAGAHERAGGAQPGHEVRDRRQVPQQLRPGRLVVRAGVGLVAVLEQHHPVGMVGGDLPGPRHGLVGAAGGRREDDLRAVHPEDLGALGRDVLRHHADQPVAAQLRHHGQRDAGVAAGRLEDGVAGPEPPVGLGGAHHVERGAVLDAAGRVAILELRPQPDVGRGRQPRQSDEGGASARVQEAVEPRHG